MTQYVVLSTQVQCLLDVARGAGWDCPVLFCSARRADLGRYGFPSPFHSAVHHRGLNLLLGNHRNPNKHIREYNSSVEGQRKDGALLNVR